MDKLLNRRIDAIRIDGDEQHYIAFDTDAGELCYEAEGDCCSESWIYHIIGVPELVGSVIQEVIGIQLADDIQDEFTRQGIDAVYCWKFTTEAGHADIEFRNSSNGYYGGWLEFMDERLIPSGVRMIPVAGDYIAQIPTIVY